MNNLFAGEEMSSHSPLLMSPNDISQAVGVCAHRKTPHLSAVEHPDLVQSLLGCHGASEWHPQAVVSTEVTPLAASWLPVMS